MNKFVNTLHNKKTSMSKYTIMGGVGLLITIIVASIVIPTSKVYEGCEELSGTALKACNEVKENKELWESENTKKIEREEEFGQEVEQIKKDFVNNLEGIDKEIKDSEQTIAIEKAKIRMMKDIKPYLKKMKKYNANNNNLRGVFSGTGASSETANQALTGDQIVPKYIVMHHTVTDSSEGIEHSHENRSEGESKSEMDSHVYYHVIIEKDGTFKQHRKITEWSWATRENNAGFHIAMVGNFDIEHPTVNQLLSAKKLINDVRAEFGELKVYEHGELEGESSRCAGENFYVGLLSDESIKQIMEGKTTEPVIAHKVVAPVAVVAKPVEVDPTQEGEYIGKYLLTRYYTPVPGQERYYRDTYEQDFVVNCQGDCTITADGTKLDNSLVGKVFACPPNIAHQTKLKLVYHYGYELVGTCHDRGGAIKGKRLDIRSGIGMVGLNNIKSSPTPTPAGEVDVYIL